MKVITRRFFMLMLFTGLSFSILMGADPYPERPADEVPRMLKKAESLRYIDPDSCLKILENALSLTKEAGSDSLQAETEYLLARAYMSKGYYNTALASGFEALHYFESVGDSSGMGKVKHRMATIYLETENIALSRQYDQEALNLLDPVKDSLDIAWTLLDMGNYMDYTDQHDLSFYYYFMSLEIARQINDGYAAFSCYNNLALLYQENKEFETALEYYQKGMEITLRNEDFSSTAFILNNIGLMYFKWGKLPEARQYCEQAYGMAPEHQSASGLVNIHSNLAMIYEANQKWDQAFVHQKAYTELIQNYFNEKISSSMADMEGKYQNEKKQAEIALLNKENELNALVIERQKTLQKLMAGGLVLLVFLVIFIVVAYRDKQKTNQLLSEQQEEIKRINSGLEQKVKERTEALARANRDLTDLLYRTSHDLRSPLTKIMGLMELTRSGAMPASEVLKHVEETTEILNRQNLSVCEIGEIREHIPAPQSIELRKTLLSLLDTLKIHPPVSADRIKLEVDPTLTCSLDPFLLGIAVK